MIFLFVLGFLDFLRKGKKDGERLGDYQEHGVENLIEVGVFYLEKDEVEKALDNFFEALENYRKVGDVEGEGYAHELIGDCYLSERNFEAAFREYEHALKCYDDAGSPLKEELLEKIKEAEMIKEALEESSETVKVDVQEEDDTAGVVSKEEIGEGVGKVSGEDVIKKIDTLILELIGLIDKYNSYKGLVDDLRYLEDALESSKLIEDWEGEGTLHLIMGEILFRRGEHNKSLEHFREAYNIFKDRDRKGEGISLLLVGVTSFVLGEVEIHEILNQAMKMLCEVSDDACNRAYDIIEALETL
ncbi:MAG TPA: tetratricopeptide repeat protein [Methanothermobacter sp.]|nr:conserved hypothetical protein [Methanothermobacter sp. MT-2]HHW05216.1 tetratricopeptide repeat protein [Methanothermobacter sp.]HOK72746.1 tetratricopeptide repeat protein [Methanothermobacter sp.]HOL69627.1 tetratricopeptide repeat protein [Methanothermobacter sp.]HPQ05210.1 tetratricopeptide repeat protein [Methanothermobacter sp.]